MLGAEDDPFGVGGKGARFPGVSHFAARKAPHPPSAPATHDQAYGLEDSEGPASTTRRNPWDFKAKKGVQPCHPPTMLATHLVQHWIALGQQSKEIRIC